MTDAGGAQSAGAVGASDSSTGQDRDWPVCSCGRVLFLLARTAQGQSQP